MCAMPSRRSAFIVVCPTCGQQCLVPHPPSHRQYTCWNCGAVVWTRPEPSAAVPAGTALGGVALGAALGGPPGAVVGGILGLILGLAASKS